MKNKNSELEILALSAMMEAVQPEPTGNRRAPYAKAPLTNVQKKQRIKNKAQKAARKRNRK